jgi:ribosomal protein L37E
MDEFSCRCGHKVFKIKFQPSYGVCRMRCEHCGYITSINLREMVIGDDDIPF